MKTLKNKAKKGFTIVELVIVIAVIAILAAVLIPTFTNVVASANESAAMQESRNEWTEYLVEIAADGEYTSKTYYVVYTTDSITYEFEVDKGDFNTEPETTTNTYQANSGYIAIKNSYSYSNEKVTIYAPDGTTDSAKEAAVTAASDSTNGISSANAGDVYYAKVTVSSTSYYYFKFTVKDTTPVTYSVVSSTASAYSGAGTGKDDITNGNYTINFKPEA